jgi:Serine aminopeptidase, S33
MRRIRILFYGLFFFLPVTAAAATAPAASAASAPAAAASASYRIIATRRTWIGAFVRTDTTVQVGDNPVNRFTMHRLRQFWPHHEPKAALLLLPPLGNGFTFFETDESGDYRLSFAAFFAAAGFEVWGYSPRYIGLTAGVCESGALDCSPMSGWGIQAAVDDVAFIRRQIAAAAPDTPAVVAGYSIGGVETIAVINAAPRDWTAAAILEGALYAEDPAVVALNAGFCPQLRQQIASGQIFDDQSLPVIRTIAELAATDPHGPTPFPGFPPGLTNHQLLVFILAVPGFGPFWQTPHFVRCAGDVAADVFFFASTPRVVAHTLLFSDYYDNREVSDTICSLAGDRTFTANLGAFTAPVYLMGGGQAFLEQQVELTHVLGSRDVTRNFQPEFGHADHWFSASHRQLLDSDLLRWLERVAHERDERSPGGGR